MMDKLKKIRWNHYINYAVIGIFTLVFGMTILLIEHDMKFVSGLCDEITVLNFGTVLAQGDTKTALNDPEVIKAYIGG